MRKTIQITTLLILFSAAIFSSCSETEAPAPQSNLIDYQSIIENVKAENGMLHFDSFEAFQDAIHAFSDTKERNFSEPAFLKWENKMGLNSLRGKQIALMDAFEALESETDKEAFIKNHENEIMMEDGMLFFPIDEAPLASVINTDGQVLINNILHCFTSSHQIIIMDKDEEKLRVARQALRTDSTLGMYVFERILDLGVLRGQCGQSRSCTGTQGSKRVTGRWKLSLSIRPVTAVTIPGPIYTGAWRASVNYHCKMNSWKRGWPFGSWIRNRDDRIKWGTGYGVQTNWGLTTGGTGWTIRGVSEINHHIGIVNDQFINTQSIYYYFTYNNTHVENLDREGLMCEDDCF